MMREKEVEGDDDIGGVSVNKGCILEEFTEYDDVMNILIRQDQNEELQQRLVNILHRYLEQPHLLESKIPALLTAAAERTRSGFPNSTRHTSMSHLYLLLRVRGYKIAVRYLPHEISDLQPVLTFLEELNPNDSETWKSRFVLLLWLSIIVMMPFPMSRLDSFTSESTSENSDRKTVMTRIFDLCKTYSLVTDACSEAAAFLCSKFFTRSDVKELYLGSFFEWSCKQNSDLHEEDKVKYGVLASVASILKHGKREDLLPFANTLLHWVTKQNYRQNKAILTRKYATKIIQRIGLTFLKSHIASWRYTRGSRSLATNLNIANDENKENNSNLNNHGTVVESPCETESEEEDIPEQIEEVIEELFLGLRDADTIVRWSAAKGIGRISNRLGKNAVIDVVIGLMDLFSPREGDTAWHGGCLALAELGRRGLLLPSQLPDVVKVVQKALQYEEFRGHTATGQHVRDAACYVCWAFARAYDANVLQPFVKDIATGLIITTVYDREINCRRAASAAFQENVGRQGSFPHGIDILTAADFFSVGLRNNAFLQIAPWIAQFSEYTTPMIDHLVEKKVDHWDIAIRELTSKALHNLTVKNPEYMSENVLPQLVEKSNSNDLNTRHGAILAVGEIIHALALIEKDKTNTLITIIPNDVLESVKNLVSILNKKYLFRGLGGELMRQACCVCIEKVSLSKINFHGDPVIDEWLALIEECLMHEAVVIREKAIAALFAAFNEYLVVHPNSESNKQNDQNLKEIRSNLISKYCKMLENTGSNGMFVRMGYSLAIGSLPAIALEESIEQVIRSLINCCYISDATLKWAEARRDAIKGLTNICLTLGMQNLSKLTQGNGDICGVYQVFNCLLKCLEEYTIDMRGDIGAWVREASMGGILSLSKQCAKEDFPINAHTMQKIMTGIAQQAVEKIDRTRAYAGKVFTNLIHCKPSLSHIPQHSQLLKIFPDPPEESSTEIQSQLEAPCDRISNSSSTILWLFAEHTMPRFVQLLDWEVYRYSIILGLTVSVGDMTENLVKHAGTALFAYLNNSQNDSEKMSAICDTIIQVFNNKHGDNRVTIPMLNFMDRLLSSGSLNSVLEETSNQFADQLLNHVKIEMKCSGNMYKHLDSISVLCQLIQVGGNVSRSSLSKIMISLCNSHKYVRKSTASRLYDALLIYGEMTGISDENLDQVMVILAETNWEQEVSALRPIRNNMCALIGIEPPVAIKKP